jgi:hypothetical protein
MPQIVARETLASTVASIFYAPICNVSKQAAEERLKCNQKCHPGEGRDLPASLIQKIPAFAGMTLKEVFQQSI